jgi:hypothetical protein
VRRPAGAAVAGVSVELRSPFLVQAQGLVRDVSFFGPASSRRRRTSPAAI